MTYPDTDDHQRRARAELYNWEYAHVGEFVPVGPRRSFAVSVLWRLSEVLRRGL